MDRITAIVWGLVALGAILAFVIYWIIYRNRRLRTTRRIDDLLEEYFQGKMPVGQLGQHARAIASRGFFGGPTFLSLADRQGLTAEDAQSAVGDFSAKVGRVAAAAGKDVSEEK